MRANFHMMGSPRTCLECERCSPDPTLWASVNSWVGTASSSNTSQEANLSRYTSDRKLTTIGIGLDVQHEIFLVQGGLTLGLIELNLNIPATSPMRGTAGPSYGRLPHESAESPIELAGPSLVAPAVLTFSWSWVLIHKSRSVAWQHTELLARRGCDGPCWNCYQYSVKTSKEEG